MKLMQLTITVSIPDSLDLQDDRLEPLCDLISDTTEDFLTLSASTVQGNLNEKLRADFPDVAGKLRVTLEQ